MSHDRWTSDRVRLVLNGAVLLILLGVAAYLELSVDRASSGDKCNLLECSDAEGSAAEYAKVTSSGYREVESRHVTVVPLTSADPDAILDNVCKQRWYLARLVRELDAAGATAIVLDKFFSPTSCPKGDPARLTS